LFGEAVPYFEKAIEIAQTADIFVVVGTSLAVYPAASLIYNIRPNVPIYLVDPGQPALANVGNKVTHIKEKSATGLPKLVNILINNQ
jgi:NAD-dependent deacetylase